MKFAQIKLGLLFAMISAHATAMSASEQLLVGFYVNKVEKDSIDALKMEEQYFIPFDVFVNAIQIKPSKTTSGWLIESPIGNLKLSDTAIKKYRNKSYVNIIAIKKLGIHSEFNQSDYAIKLYTPWSKADLLADKPNSTVAPKIDYYPNSVGIHQININGGINQSIKDRETTNSKQHVKIGLRGNAFGGLWGGQVSYQHSATKDTITKETSNNKTPLEVNRLYWANYAEKSAVQIGTNSHPSFSLVDQDNFSGISLAYSNKGIQKHLSSFTQSNNTLLKTNSGDYRNIRGQGPVGGIAELRVNTNPVARVRIGTDKTYQFTNLNLNKLNEYKKTVEIALFEHSFSNQPIKVIPYRFNKRESNVATDELLTEVGVGMVGNALDITKDSTDQTINNDQSTITSNQDKDLYTYAYAEYGLYNNMALRSGFTYSDQISSLIGLNIGISPTINWDATYQNKATSHAYESLMSYAGKHVGATYQFRYQKNPNKLTKTSKSHALFLYLSPISVIDLSLNVHQNEKVDTKGKTKEAYVTAGTNIRLHKNLLASLNIDKNRNLQKKINWYLPKYHSKLFFNHDSKQYGININSEVLPNLLLGLEWQHYQQTKSEWLKAYSEFAINDNNKLFANASGQQEKRRYEFGWHHHRNNGVNLSVGYDYNIDNSLVKPDSRHHFYLQFNLPFIHIPQKGYHIQQYYGNNNRGAVIADIHYDESLFSDATNTNMVVKLNGKTTNARHLSDGKYLIENLKPGIYQLNLSNKNLPIEYSTDELPTVTIKVNKASTTVVPYHLEKRFGFSGKLYGIQNSNQTITVDIYKGNKKITSTQSNAFGYYQVLGLKAGDYVIKAQGYKETQVTLKNGFLFEVDLNKIIGKTR